VAVEGLREREAHRAIDAAFADLAEVHRLMSYHAAGSDLSRLNREAARTAIAVHPWTLDVLDQARRLSERSDGVFDVTSAGRLVADGALPDVDGAPPPDPEASWRDILLDAVSGVVRFRRPLRIDLGGIAKGAAVDRAVEALITMGAPAGVVNAGGDLRAFGLTEHVALRTGAVGGPAPIMEIRNGALASSGTLDGERCTAAHVDGRCGGRIEGRFVCVAAPRCVWADGLTKVVLALGDACAPVLAAFGAVAHVLEADLAWRSHGAAA
jgi:thiamine biosynthesis lipoprotein